MKETTRKDFSLVDCVNAIPQGEQKKLKKELYEALGISPTNRPSYYRYIKGESMLSLRQALNVEKVFKNYQIIVPWRNKYV